MYSILAITVTVHGRIWKLDKLFDSHYALYTVNSRRYKIGSSEKTLQKEDIRRATYDVTKKSAKLCVTTCDF